MTQDITDSKLVRDTELKQAIAEVAGVVGGPDFQVVITQTMTPIQSWHTILERYPGSRELVLARWKQLQIRYYRASAGAYGEDVYRQIVTKMYGYSEDEINEIVGWANGS